MRKRKDPAAVALGRRGAQARLAKHTPAQRSAQARRAVQTRWAKAAGKQPVRWWGFFSVNDPKQPEALFWSQDKREVMAWARQHPDFGGFIDFIEGYDPRLTITTEFKPDAAAQVKALRVVLGDEGGEA